MSILLTGRMESRKSGLQIPILKSSTKKEVPIFVNLSNKVLEGRLEQLIDLVKLNLLSLKDAAEQARLSEEEFSKRMNSYRV